MNLILKLRLLRQRYEECDTKGHLKLDITNNYCSYCYRHLTYEQPEHSNNNPSERQKLRNIRIQRRIDYNNGLRMLENELN